MHKDALFKEGLATISFIYCVDMAQHRGLPSWDGHRQVLKDKQKDNLRTHATDKDNRKLQSVSFNIKDQMRLGPLSLSSSIRRLHISIAGVLHSSAG